MRKWLVVIAFIVAVLVAVLVPAQTISDYRADHGWIVRIDGSARSSHIYDKGCYSPDGHTQLTDCIIWRTDDGGPFGIWPDPAVRDGKLWWPLGQTAWLEASCAWASYAQSGNYSNQCSLTDGSAVLAVFDTRTLAMYGLAYSVGGAIRPVFPITYVPEVKPTWTPTRPPAPSVTKQSVSGTPTAAPSGTTASPTITIPGATTPLRTPSRTPTEPPCQFGSLCPSPGVTTITPSPSHTPVTVGTITATPTVPTRTAVVPATASPTLTPSSTYPRATVVVAPRRTRTTRVGSRLPEPSAQPTLGSRVTPAHAFSVTVLGSMRTKVTPGSSGTTTTATPTSNGSQVAAGSKDNGYTPSKGSYFAFLAILGGLAIKFRAWLAMMYGRVLNWFRSKR